MSEIFQNPRRPYARVSGEGFTLQIASPLPDPVPIGHLHPDTFEAVIDEVVSRADYLDRIQEACATHKDAYTVRFYRHPEGFDASVLDQLNQIRWLQIDPVCPVTNPEAVGRLPHLTGLNYAPRGKTNPNVLAALGVQRLTSFTLAETGTPPLDLTPLGEAHSLRTLRLLAQGKNIGALAKCTSLVELSMQPQEAHPLEFISQLARLEILKFSLGKRRSILAIETAPSLRDLSFHLVNMLDDLGDLQRFPRLRRLQIEQQKRLKTVKVGPGNLELEHISAEGLEQVIGLSTLPALKSLSIFNGKINTDWSELPRTLTHFALTPPGLKARERHYTEVKSRGLIPEAHPEATFFYK